jgi:hypothetical protein
MCVVVLTWVNSDKHKNYTEGQMAQISTMLLRLLKVMYNLSTIILNVVDLSSPSSCSCLTGTASQANPLASGTLGCLHPS